jgi:hypothetical protein
MPFLAVMQHAQTPFAVLYRVVSISVTDRCDGTNMRPVPTRRDVRPAVVQYGGILRLK